MGAQAPVKYHYFYRFFTSSLHRRWIFTTAAGKIYEKVKEKPAKKSKRSDSSTSSSSSTTENAINSAQSNNSTTSSSSSNSNQINTFNYAQPYAQPYAQNYAYAPYYYGYTNYAPSPVQQTPVQQAHKNY